MSTFPVGIRSPLPYSNVKQASDFQSGELVAATPLGRDENGKNLVAYIVRTEDEAPQYRPPNNLANGNAQKKTYLSEGDAQALKQAFVQPQNNLASEKRADKYTPKDNNKNTTALFVKPDNLLNPLEQAQIDQLRARNSAINLDATQLDDGKGNALLTSLVYSTGPDGRRYAVGVSAPLLTQNAKQQQNITDETVTDKNTPSGKAVSAYARSAYYNSSEYRSGLLDNTL